ncbi:hypothetical protein [Ancylomarina sp. 16SWW S1-10-2]|uniref:hypothetical protein n=1 Tax=Ancylomarina sp. 16SWW S1-10-2 TaxID=2499681 RepID=UPI0012AE0C59|nr:hypothetical protein [Ancylomarina sp. 16SWW S1-10-2]MRT91982.1 hypothetical protein [Ancylomarina sp. 16SWW S1-10-2]
MIFIKLRNIALFLCLLLPFNKLVAADITLSSQSEKVHQVIYKHPAQKDSSQMNQTLFETPDKAFYMDVVSVYCFADVCKIDTVRIYWNDIGKYQKFELKPGINLEKAKGEVFTAPDYKKLQLILKDENSPFKNISIDNIISTQQTEYGDIDAFSGATAINLDESVSIKGAVLTVYTLWHWANGGLVSMIRKITADAANSMDLIDYLANKDVEHKLFAIEQLTKRKAYDALLLESVKSQYGVESQKLKRSVISYLENAPEEVYINAIMDLFDSDNSKQRIDCLQSLIVSDTHLTVDLYQKLYRQLCHQKTYHEVDLLFTLLEKNTTFSDEQIDPLFIFLTNSNILISRRAYWFLENKNINKRQEKILKEFLKKNSEYL